MLEEQILEKLFHISKQQAELLDTLKSGKHGHKDFWEKLTGVAPIISALIVAFIGAYFTYTYNQQQLKLQEIQTIERFLPHLAGDERNKRAAILAISSLGDAKLAAKVASVFASEGTASALRTIAKNSEPSDQQAVREALYKTLDAMADKYKDENKYDDAVQTYQKAIETKEAILGKDNPNIADSLTKLAVLYEEHGDHEAAEALLKRSAYLKRHALNNTTVDSSKPQQNADTSTNNINPQPDSSNQLTPAKPTKQVLENKQVKDEATPVKPDAP